MEEQKEQEVQLVEETKWFWVCTYMKVPYTHNSALKKEMERISRESGLLVKFVEMSGYG